MTSPSIAVIIVNWNSRDDVLEALQSLQEQTDGDLDIRVVDNGSVDDSVSSIRSQYPGTVVLAAGKNLGFAEGCNLGIAETRSDWVFLLNNDAVAAPDCVALLRKVAAEAPPNVGMIQPRVVFRARPDRINSSGVVVFRSGRARDRNFAEPLAAAPESTEVFCPTGSAALYRRTMLDEVHAPSGYFDRDFFMYFEDVDLGWRCRLAGWHAVYVPEAVVLHRFQASSSRLGPSFSERHCRINRISTLLKNASLQMIAQSLGRTFYDLYLLASEHPPSLWRLVTRLPRAFRGRREIERIRKMDRRKLEKHWMNAVESPVPALEELLAGSSSPVSHVGE